MARTKQHFTFKDRPSFIWALEVALLSQLFADGSAGDVCLDAKAVALSTVKVSQLDHIGLWDVHFLEATQDNNLAWSGITC